MELMKSFVLHIYPRDNSNDSSDQNSEIVGTVESIEDEKQTPFTSPQELWEILAEKDSENLTNTQKENTGYST